MKHLFTRLSSFLLLLVGVALTGQFIRCPYICSYIARLYDGSLDVGFPGSTLLASGIILILIGGYSLIASLPIKERKYKILKQNFDRGYAEINIASLEKECVAMLKRVAPLKQVTVALTPEKENKVKAEIRPIVVIDDEQNLPAIEKILATRLEEFLNSYFGIELLKPVIVKIDEFQMESEKIYHLLGKPGEEVAPQSEGKSQITSSEEFLTCSTSIGTSEGTLSSTELNLSESATSNKDTTITSKENNFLKCRSMEDVDQSTKKESTQENSLNTLPLIEPSDIKEETDPRLT
ncbi:MAG: alkaline shock response membrane anchor protein AmaP [Candidatus Hydrogenedentes bacterium]|nr:alkaline shock response membrane anchor protein AmaP [Candidatus Hydrogenedentota bacterium]